MDAYELYVKYNSSTDMNSPKVKQDANTIHLARMMDLLPECARETKETKETKETVETVDMTGMADMSELTDAPTASNTPNTRRWGRIPKEPTSSGCLSPYVSDCDTLMMDLSRQRIGALCRIVKASVKISWVHAFASVVISPTIPNQQQYETLAYNSTSSVRHVHIVNSSVLVFLTALKTVEADKITTFAWSHSSQHAIHLQLLDGELRSRFRNVVPVFSATVLASIGLPMHELFKIKDYFKNTRTWRFKNMTRDSLIKTTLRSKLKVQKIDNALEANQLLEEYSKKETIFDIATTQETVEHFMFKHWYSYPTASEMDSMLERAGRNLNRWLD